MFFLEHKSTFSLGALIQMLFYMVATLFRRWKDNDRKDSLLHSLHCPVGGIFCHGKERNWPTDMQFCDIFAHCPKSFRKCMINYKPFIIDLNTISYDDIKGKPLTRVIVETFKRYSDQTHKTYLFSILHHLKNVQITEQINFTLKNCFTYYKIVCDGSSYDTVNRAFQEALGEEEGKEMSAFFMEDLKALGFPFVRKEGIAIGTKRGWEEGIAIGTKRGREEGFAIGVENGRVECKLEMLLLLILSTLKNTFGRLPEELCTYIQSIKDRKI